MLRIFHIYTYKEICEILGWNVAQGNTRKAQMRKLSDSYDWEYVINEKTGKPSKRILIKAYKKPLVDDYRKFNGKKKQIPDEVFFSLWETFLRDYYNNTKSDILFFGRSVLRSVFLDIHTEDEICAFIKSYSIDKVIVETTIRDMYKALNSLCVDRIMRHHGYDERSFSLINIAGDTWGKSLEELEAPGCVIYDYKLCIDTYKDIFKDENSVNGFMIAQLALNKVKEEHPEMKLIRMYQIVFDPDDISTVTDVGINKDNQRFVRKILIDTLIRKYGKKLEYYRSEHGVDNGLFVADYTEEIVFYSKLLECVLTIRDDFIRDMQNISQKK